MSAPTIRTAYPSWPLYNRRLRDAVAGLSEEQLAFRPSPDRWPLWATVGHLACQRVFWLGVAADAPGAATSPFPDSGNTCPGDEDLEHVLSAADLAAALDATFAIVEWCLDRWTAADLAEVMAHPEWGPGRDHTRGFCLERVFAHDLTHLAEVNELLRLAGLPQVDPWG
jgi:uncharacterized damage-inducible protein DinB